MVHAHLCCQLLWALLCRRSAPQSASLAMKDATLVQHMTATLKQLLEALLTNLEAKVIPAIVTLA